MPDRPDPVPGVAEVEPAGFVVTTDGGVSLHFHDWAQPGEGAEPPAGPAPGVLLLPGLLQPAWSWAPVARRVAALRHVAVVDLRGQGLSDAPEAGYDVGTLAADAIVVAEGSGVLGEGAVVLAGTGFGGIVAAAAAAGLGDRCAGLVLVDGGWERLEVTTGLDVDEFLRGLDEPPEVMRSMDAWLGDRRGFDPATWDADQERAARDAVVETAAGRVVRAVRPFVVEAIVRTMFGYDPAPVLASVSAPVVALVAGEAGDAPLRRAELDRVAVAREAAGRSAIRITAFASAHNLMRYRPAEVAVAILEVAG